MAQQTPREPPVTLDLPASAASYASLGVKVFPCRPRDKPPLTPHGLKDASSSLGEVAAWWKRWPEANIGAPTGANAWTVMDVDTENRDEIAEIVRALDLPRTALTRTGKGRHVFFRAVPGIRPTVSIMPHLDMRSGESYVILPPSVHPNGRRYAWQVPLSEICDMPADIVARLSGRRQRPVEIGVDGPLLTEGIRRRELFRIARALASRGAVEGAVLVQLRAVNRSRCSPPLADEYLVQTARGSDRYGHLDDAEALPRRESILTGKDYVGRRRRM